MKSTTIQNARGIVFATAILAIGAGVVASSGNDKDTPTDKDRALSLDEKYERLKGGIFKMKEPEVISLFGAATSVTRPGKQDKSDLEMRWVFATRIVVTYKDGKVSESWGMFSEQLPVEPVTLETFRRVQVGMTESKVIEILGNRYASVEIDGVATGQWGASAEVIVAFGKDGRMVHHEHSGNSFGPRTP